MEVKSGKGRGKTITTLLNEKKIDKAVFFKGNTSGGVNGDKITLPLWCSTVFSYFVNLNQDKPEEMQDFI